MTVVVAMAQAKIRGDIKPDQIEDAVEIEK
jgi:hypothetical protein